MNGSTTPARAEALAYYGGPAVREWHDPNRRATTIRAVDNPVTQAVDRTAERGAA